MDNILLEHLHIQSIRCLLSDPFIRFYEDHFNAFLSISFKLFPTVSHFTPNFLVTPVTAVFFYCEASLTRSQERLICCFVVLGKLADIPCTSSRAACPRNQWSSKLVNEIGGNPFRVSTNLVEIHNAMCTKLADFLAECTVHCAVSVLLQFEF